MINPFEWSRKNITAIWTSFVFVILASSLAFIKSCSDVKELISQDKTNPDLYVIFSEGNFKNRDFDELEVVFKNRSQLYKSFSNLNIHCTKHSGSGYLIFPINEQGKMVDFMGLQVDTPPSNLGPAGNTSITLIVPKLDNQQSINQLCHTIQPVWTDENNRLVYGELLSLNDSVDHFLRQVFKGT